MYNKKTLLWSSLYDWTVFQFNNSVIQKKKNNLYGTFTLMFYRILLKKCFKSIQNRRIKKKYILWWLMIYQYFYFTFKGMDAPFYILVT